MLFFTENYPAFTGKSNFLLGEKTSTYWVESNHPGYFLVKLKNAKQAILPTDLFGDNKASSNGFEELKKLDSNGDNVIDEKDKEFKNLYLWSDANGNSKNDAKEVSSLKSKKVTSIDLKYNNDYRQDRMRAIMQGRTTFSYTNEKGVKATGEAFDIFFLGIKKK